MEKPTKKQTSRHGNSGNKTNSKANKNLYLSKIKEAKKSLDQKVKEIIVPLMKIQKKISLKFDIFIKDYNEIIKKAETAYQEIITHLEENKNDTMNITDIQLNQKYAINHENMIKFYENVANKLELFTNLINSNQYDNLIKEFNKLIDEKVVLNILEEGKDILDNYEKNCLILKKNIKKPKKNKLIGTTSKKILKRAGVKEKEKKSSIKESGTKSKKRDRDLLDILKDEFKDNNYVQKISKTFLKRRLFKNVIYRHDFIYEESGNIIEDRHRSAGESTIYKYGKFTFKFKNDEFNQEIFEKLIKYVEEELKQCFIKIDNENNEYIIGGKLKCLINDFLNKIIRKNLYINFNVVKVCVEFYEFYEELISEFNEKESNVKIINCDEKILNNLKDDWESLQLVRSFVNKNKKKLNLDVNIANDINNNENNNNNEDINANENNNIIEHININEPPNNNDENKNNNIVIINNESNNLNNK